MTVNTTKQQASAETPRKSSFPRLLTPAFYLPLLSMCKLRRVLGLQMEMQALMLVLLAVLR